MSVIEEWNRVNRTKKREAIEMEYQLARGEIYEIPSEESHQGEPSTKRRSQLENEEDIFDDAITNDSKDDVMGNDEAFESSGCEDDNEPTMDFFNFENAVSYVAAIFLHNNFSDSVAKDIFTIGKVLNQHPSIRLSDVNRKVEEWSDYDPRIYSFCVECKNLLSSANKCGNLNCGRNGVSQANVSNGNVVVTYSIKKQVQQILDNMEIGDEILTRHTTPTSLCSRCVDTPKYKERLRKSIQINPQLLPLLVSVNIDGFSRKGTSRRDDKNFDCFPEALVTVLKDFGMDVLANYIPTRLLPADANMDDKFVKALPYPFEEACKEIVRRRNSYESADKLVRHAIHGALQLLRTYHYDTANGILVNCKKRSECSTHLTWKEYKSKLGGGNQDV
ncbi:unnamed protein product [Caenorhabditis nigoni]